MDDNPFVGMPNYENIKADAERDLKAKAVGKTGVQSTRFHFCSKYVSER